MRVLEWRKQLTELWGIWPPRMNAEKSKKAIGKRIWEVGYEIYLLQPKLMAEKAFGDWPAIVPINWRTPFGHYRILERKAAFC
jgi:hypothetical protein